jgi:hypothetical protein
VLRKEKRSTGTQNPRHLNKCPVGILDCAKNQRRYHGVDACVVEGKLFSGNLYDPGIKSQGACSLPKLRRHVRIRFGEQKF